MYVPSHFEESNPEVLKNLITNYPLGVLITHGDQGLDANHLPFELDNGVEDRTMLRAHVARNNPLWKEVSTGDDVLIVFRANEAYISPNWYPSKQTTHKQVPTWNYKVVHVHGRIAVRDDEKYVRGLVARLTRQHERTQDKPWKMTDAPPDYIATMLKAIVGLEIEVTRMTGKFKLSQNREDNDRIGAGNALVMQGQQELGQAMLDVKDT